MVFHLRPSRKPQKDEALQYLALASDEVRSVLSENAPGPAMGTGRVFVMVRLVKLENIKLKCRGLLYKIEFIMGWLLDY